MRLAVLSDIHGNLEAFLQVLNDLESCHIDRVVCLGDMIGYGPEPEAVVRLIQERAIPALLGNHESALLDPDRLEWFNPICRESLNHTRTFLSNETMDYLGSLRPNRIEGDSLFVHGCPPDSVFTYLFELSESELEDLFKERPESRFFVGHTHDLLLITYDGSTISSEPLGKKTVHFKGTNRYLINVGSVGQPRDGNNQAKYIIWDDQAQSLEVRFVPYDIARTARKIIDLGFPAYHARRLG